MLSKVLIVEDDINLNRLLSRGFLSAQFHAIAVHNLAAALEALQSEVIEFVVLDLGLPDCDGWEVVRRIETLSLDYPAPQIIIVTGRDPAEALPENATGYSILQKPVSLNTLIRLAFDLRQQVTVQKLRNQSL